MDRHSGIVARVARFVMVKRTKTWKKYTKWPLNFPYGHKIYQMDVKYYKYTNIFYSKALQNIPKLVFLLWKYVYHLATLIVT
jgi:hypothetical protein